MTPLLDVLKNVGDFPGRMLQPFVNPQTGITNPGRVGVDGAGSILEAGAGFSRSQSANEPGYRSATAVRSLAMQRQRMYESDLMTASRLLVKAFNGDEYARLLVKEGFRGRLREAMSISDFPNIFGDIIDRAVIANYRETPYMWNMVANDATVQDFRPIKRFRVDYGTKVLDAVEMGGPYTERKLSDNAVAGATGQSTPPSSSAANAAGYYGYSLQKYGNRMPFFWETMIDDDLNALKDTPARFGRAARRAEEKFVTQLFANNTTFFNHSNFSNTVVATGPYTTVNPPLSISALAQAMTIMSNQRDLDGEPIEIESVVLVVPPALKVTAQNILNADYFWANDQGGTIGADGSLQRLNVANWAKNIVSLGVNYYLPIVDGTYGQQGWYLFANPKGGRPALEFGRLRGHIMPELFMKMPNAIAIGEGMMGPGPGPVIGTQSMNPIEGDFDTDAIHYKIRHVFGGTTMDPLMAVFSNGAGS
jgi:Mu-like prophage major head subunit gpT